MIFQPGVRRGRLALRLGQLGEQRGALICGRALGCDAALDGRQLVADGLHPILLLLQVVLEVLTGGVEQGVDLGAILGQNLLVDRVAEAGGLGGRSRRDADLDDSGRPAVRGADTLCQRRGVAADFRRHTGFVQHRAARRQLNIALALELVGLEGHIDALTDVLGHVETQQRRGLVGRWPVEAAQAPAPASVTAKRRRNPPEVPQRAAHIAERAGASRHFNPP